MRQQPSTIMWPATPLPPSSLLTGLQAYYKLENLNDSSGNGLTLTNNNSVTFTTGKLGNAATFVRASSQWLSHASDVHYVMGDIDFTIVAWVNLASKIVVDFDIVGKIGGTNGEYVLQYRSTAGAPTPDRFYFRVFAATGYGSEGAVMASTFGAPSLSTWYFIVAWHDSIANTLNIQINNGTVNSQSWSSGMITDTNNFLISDNNFSNYMDGMIDEVGVWKRILTTGEITTLYNGGLGLTYPF